MDGDLRSLLLLVIWLGVVFGLIYSAGNYAGREAERLHLMNDGSTAYGMSIDGSLCFSGSIWWPARTGACVMADAPK